MRRIGHLTVDMVHVIHALGPLDALDLAKEQAEMSTALMRSSVMSPAMCWVIQCSRGQLPMLKSACACGQHISAVLFGAWDRVKTMAAYFGRACS